MGVRPVILAGLALFACGEEIRLSGDAGVPDGGLDRACIISSDIVEDTVLGSGFCRAYLVEAAFSIRQGATLGIAPGTQLAFERGAGITVGDVSDGRLQILGSPEAPVVLTSIATGDDVRWNGVAFRGNTLPGSIIRNTVVSAAEGAAGGCVMVDDTAPDAVTLEALRIESCSSAGLWIDVASLELVPPIAIADSKIGVSLAARNVGALVAMSLENVEANEIRGGPVTESASWVAQSVPWIVSGNIEVEGPSVPVLTLERGLHLRFDQSTWLAVGDGAPGSLSIRGSADAPVLLEADNSGGWHGVVVGPQADARTGIQYAVIRGGGRRGENVRGCLTIRGSTPITVESSRFEACEQAGIGAIDPFFRFTSLTENTFAGSSVGLWLNARAVGSIDSEQTFEGVPTNMMDGDEISKDEIWIRQSVPWVVKDSISVQGPSQPILRIEEGVVLRFAPSSWLEVGSAATGGLFATGSLQRPVVFESALPQPTPGSWRGIVFGGNAIGSRLERAIIRHGGQMELDAKGCVTVRGRSQRSISIVRSELESCAQASIAAVDGAFAFETLQENTFRDSEVGLHLAASSVASVTTPQFYERVPINRIDGDRISFSGTWLPQDVPWVVRGSITVEGPNAPALTLAQDLALLFDDGALMTVGADEPAELVIAGAPQSPVILESARDTPSAGDWGGLFLGPQVAMSTRIDYLHLSHGGQPVGPIRGGITLSGTQSRVRIASSAFTDNAQADIFVDCNSMPLLTANVYSVGVISEPMCN